jgi:multidrug efflux pump
VGVTALNVVLFIQAPKGFFPEQDSGQIFAGLSADRSISTQAMGQKLQQVVDIIRADPAVDTVVGFTGGGRAGGGFMFLNLKPLSERKEGGQAVIARLRPKLSQQVSGLRVFLNPTQDLRMGGRSTSSTYQYALKSDSLDDLRVWSRRLADELKLDPRLSDVDSDDAENSIETRVVIDRDSAARLGVRPIDIDNALYDAFGQRAVSTIYGDTNQYKLIMEWAPGFIQGPAALNDVQVPARRSTAAAVSANPAQRDAATAASLSTEANTMVPLSAVARFAEGPTPTSIQHEGGENTTTLSFNLSAGTSLGQARDIVAAAEARIALPTNVHGGFAGTALSFEQTQGQQVMLIAAALAVIYIVLGVLYESLVHPVTVLSTLPAAGVGAVMALLLMRMDVSIMALIGLFLLIGIVKKNAILIIDVALDLERQRGLSAQDAVREACLLRLRPILMTTLAAGLGALPLAVGLGEGAELRQALGVTILGGLVASQLLTLLTTPVVYVLLDGLRRRRGTTTGTPHLKPAATRPESA